MIRRPISVGSGPDKALPDKSKCVRLVRDPISVGIGPISKDEDTSEDSKLVLGNPFRTLFATNFCKGDKAVGAAVGVLVGPVGTAVGDSVGLAVGYSMTGRAVALEDDLE